MFDCFISRRLVNLICGLEFSDGIKQFHTTSFLNLVHSQPEVMTAIMGSG